jgi:hypothetical protein
MCIAAPGGHRCPDTLDSIFKTSDLCNWMKFQHCWPYGELHPAETPKDWWDVISINFIVELPQTHGYNVIMNVVNSVTKWVQHNDQCGRSGQTIPQEGLEACGSVRSKLPVYHRVHMQAVSTTWDQACNIDHLLPTNWQPDIACEPRARGIPAQLHE